MNKTFFKDSQTFWCFMILGIALSMGTLPFAASIIGGALVIIRTIVYFVVKSWNPHAIPEVKMPPELVLGGPYSIVRHPLYVSSMIWFIALPLLFRSDLALLPAFGLVGITISRIYEEERYLRVSEVYRRYCARVRWRLVPFVW
jgi:protein-S-isoprenylcysteine O-methyltransferase Ste14